jgi:hypothetical protein
MASKSVVIAYLTDAYQLPSDVAETYAARARSEGIAVSWYHGFVVRYDGTYSAV